MPRQKTARNAELVTLKDQGTTFKKLGERYDLSKQGAQDAYRRAKIRIGKANQTLRSLGLSTQAVKPLREITCKPRPTLADLEVFIKNDMRWRLTLVRATSISKETVTEIAIFAKRNGIDIKKDDKLSDIGLSKHARRILSFGLCLPPGREKLTDLAIFIRDNPNWKLIIFDTSGYFVYVNSEIATFVRDHLIPFQ